MRMKIAFCFMGLLIPGLIPAAAEENSVVDPCFSDQLHTLISPKDTVTKGLLPARISRLKAERERMLKSISVLPQHTPKPMSDHLGYHSMPIEIPSGEAQHIDIQFEFHSKLDSIAFMPVLVSGESGPEAYAFPKRFKIDVLENRGEWIAGDAARWEERRDQAEWVEVANWMDADFPDPGPYPVFFQCSGQQVYQVQISFPQGGADSVGEYYALGELYLFRRNTQERMSDNMMGWGPDVKIEASHSLSKPPLWHVQYLKDGFAGLGLPLSEEISDGNDLMVTWDEEEPSGPVEIIMDLGEVREVGGVHLWPAEAPYGMAVPLFGFPGKVKVEFSRDPDFKEVRMAEVRNAREQLYRDNLLIIATRAYEARYVRITLNEFSNYQNRSILGLGEIRVGEYNNYWSTDCAVSATGLPDHAVEQLPRLVDGFSRNRRILSESERIKGLAQRRSLDRKLVMVEQELALVEHAWGALQLRLSVSGGVLLLLVLFLGWCGQRRQRKRELSKLKQRITRDLHDEVGSSLGGISLMSEELESMAVNETVKEELGELTLMAREACSSLREVVWVTDQNVILLPELINKMVERAERMLRGVELQVELSSELPNVEISLNLKRHLIMLFREAIHNCARHAGATKVKLSATADHTFLRISVQDNGCGFDTSAGHAGWGVESMKKRAVELGGILELNSSPGEGTEVAMKIRLAMLSNDPSIAYKTSN